MHVAISGSSGLIGSTLRQALQRDGHQVTALVRRPPQATDEVMWNATDGVDPQVLTGIDAVVHLAGASLGGRRWSPGYKKVIRDSRVNGTTAISQSIAAATDGPRALLCASAVGWYGNTGSQIVDESAPPGHGFLAHVCEEWENATNSAEKSGVSVIHLRSGLVLSATGGTLGRMLPLFKAGLGGRLGSGEQYWPWISLVDEVRAIQFLLTKALDGYSGPVNLTGPLPVTNAEFTATLGQLLHRPTLMSVPRFALRFAFSDFADEAALASARVIPETLKNMEFEFHDSTVDEALRSALGR